MFCPLCRYRVVHKLQVEVLDLTTSVPTTYKCSQCKELFRVPMANLTLLMMRGLNSSGKTVYSKSIVTSSPNYVRVSKRELRRELGWDPKNPDLEMKLGVIRDMQIREALAAGKSVVSDDCNFDLETETKLREIAKNFNADFRIQFLSTPLEECLRRNSYRLQEDKLEASQIEEMSEKYKLSTPRVEGELIYEGAVCPKRCLALNSNFPARMKWDSVLRGYQCEKCTTIYYKKAKIGAEPPVVGVDIMGPVQIPMREDPPAAVRVGNPLEKGGSFPKLVHDDAKMNAVVVNLDCLAIWDKEKREYCEYEKGHLDKVNPVVKKIIMTMHKYCNYQIIYMCGRENKFYSPTIRFLSGNLCPMGPLYMRTEKDARQEWIVFGDMLNQHVRDKYNVVFVLDNDKDTIDFWRSIGATTLQTDEGNF